MRKHKFVIITYDIPENHKKVRDAVREEIENHWDSVKLSESTYAVCTLKTPFQVYNEFVDILNDGGDNPKITTFFVIKGHSNLYYCAPKKFMDWFESSDT